MVINTMEEKTREKDRHRDAESGKIEARITQPYG